MKKYRLALATSGKSAGTVDVGYNSRLQAASFTIPTLINKTYQYSADGKLSYSHDLIDQRFDRGYSYDHAARMTQALSGAEARGQGSTNDRPYKQTLYTITALHETLHLMGLYGGGFTDEALGRAAYDITGDTYGLPTTSGPNAKAISDWSTYVDRQLARKCAPGKIYTWPKS